MGKKGKSLDGENCAQATRVLSSVNDTDSLFAQAKALSALIQKKGLRRQLAPVFLSIQALVEGRLRYGEDDSSESLQQLKDWLDGIGKEFGSIIDEEGLLRLKNETRKALQVIHPGLCLPPEEPQEKPKEKPQENKNELKGKKHKTELNQKISFGDFKTQAEIIKALLCSNKGEDFNNAENRIMCLIRQIESFPDGYPLERAKICEELWVLAAKAEKRIKKRQSRRRGANGKGKSCEQRKIDRRAKRGVRQLAS